MELTTRPNGAGEFTSYAQVLLRGGKSLIDAELFAKDNARLPMRVKGIIKSAVEVGTTSDPSWGTSLADYKQISKGFVESLADASVFDRLLKDRAMRKIPLKTRIKLSSSVQGSTVDEGKAMPVTRSTIDSLNLEPQKASALIVISNELAISSSNEAQSLLSKELQSAVGVATDATFLTSLISGVTPIVSSGDTAVNVAVDVKALLASVTLKSTSKQYLITDPTIAANLSVMTDTNGVPVYPKVTPMGGELFGIPLLVTDQLPRDSDGGSLVLIDASGIAGNNETVLLDTSEQALVEIMSDPSEVANPDVILTSLWENRLKAIAAHRYYGFRLLESSAIAMVNGVNY
ncbi:MAG: phage major capsid protein [Methylophilaceae bacterium]